LGISVPQAATCGEETTVWFPELAELSTIPSKGQVILKAEARNTN